MNQGYFFYRYLPSSEWMRAGSNWPPLDGAAAEGAGALPVWSVLFPVSSSSSSRDAMAAASTREVSAPEIIHR